MEVDSLSGEIGKGLQWLRKSLLLTQYQLATFAELDYRHYQNIETGRVEVKVETLRRICVTFGIGLSTFFFLLDRRPWLSEAHSKKGGSDLYLFRMIMEQASFRLLPTVHELLAKWGRDIAEGSRENLSQCLVSCIEADTKGKVLWKNPAAQAIWGTDDANSKNFITAALEHAQLKHEIQNFWERRCNTFYIELSDAPQNCVVVGLRPLRTKNHANVFLAFVQTTESPINTSSWLLPFNAGRAFL